MVQQSLQAQCAAQDLGEICELFLGLGGVGACGVGDAAEHVVVEEAQGHFPQGAADTV